VVFVSDHGDYLGDHGFVGKGLHFDPVLHVPLIIAGPGIMTGGCIEQPASILDLAPTLLEMAGIDAGEGVQGVSCAAALRGAEGYARTAALTENDDDRLPVRMRTLTTAEWRLTVRAGSEEGELYDRRADPTESTNRFAEPGFAEVRRDLQAALFEELLCAYDNVNGRRQAPAPPVTHWVPSHNRLA
jgi:arylsulfatase A-like enzyme